MFKKRSLFLAPLSFFMFTSVAVAAPTIPDGPDGVIFACQEAQDDLGCFGQLVDSSGDLMRRKQVNRILRREYIRPAKRARRQARRSGDFELADTYTQHISLYKSIKQAGRECIFWEDDSCNGSGGGEGGGGTGGGGEGGGGSTAEACTALSGIGADAMQTRIVNGAICETGRSPAVEIRNNGSQHCTGVYIGPGIVLTAGHCVHGTTCSNLTVSGVAVSSCTLHPNYDANAQNGFEDHDVALLFLSGNLDANIAPVATTPALTVGTKFLIAGFGRNETEVTGGNLQDFRAGFNTVSSLTDGGITATFDYSDKNQANSCNGDSGGPLFALLNGVYTVYGTVSWGVLSNCGFNDNGQSDTSVWARVTHSSIQQFLAANTDGIVD
jgi:hypothetical protein